MIERMGSFAKPKKPGRAPRTDPKETSIQSVVRICAKSLDVQPFKFASPNRRSVPDYLYFNRHGFVFLIEFKRLGEKPTTRQAESICALRARGVHVYVCDAKHHGCALVRILATFRAGDVHPPGLVEDPYTLFTGDADP